MTWDLTNQYRDHLSESGATQGSTFDPFSNQPLSLSYNFLNPSLLSIAFAQAKDMPATCPPPNVCVIYDKYKESGPGTFYWQEPT